VTAGAAPGKAALAAGAFVVVTALCGLALRPDVRLAIDGDGVGYYAPLASLVAQGDLDLRDEIVPQVSPRILRAVYLTPDGRVGDPFAVGPALLWAPAVWAVHRLPPLAALDAPPVQPWRLAHPAYAPRYVRAIFWTDVAAVLVAGALLAAILSLQLGVGPAVLGSTGAVFGTPAFAYVLFEPSYAHAASFATACLVVATAILDRRRPLPLAILGASVGLAALMRWQDVLLGVAFAPRLVSAYRAGVAPGSSRARRAACAARTTLRFAAPIAVLCIPQVLFWSAIYGRPLLIPPGPEFLPPWKLGVVPMLLSTWNGAFVWSPLLLAGLLGLRLVPAPSFRRSLWVAGALLIVTSAFLVDWWGGRSFGARRLVSLAPVAAYGVGLVLQRADRRRRYAVVAFVVLACGWNTSLIRCQRHGLLPPNPGHQPDYTRHHLPGSPPTRPYGLWDYPRLVSEWAQAHASLQRRRNTDARR
jgi:hypothetical protein